MRLPNRRNAVYVLSVVIPIVRVLADPQHHYIVRASARNRVHPSHRRDNVAAVVDADGLGVDGLAAVDRGFLVRVSVRETNFCREAGLKDGCGVEVFNL